MLLVSTWCCLLVFRSTLPYLPTIFDFFFFYLWSMTIKDQGNDSLANTIWSISAQNHFLHSTLRALRPLAPKFPFGIKFLCHWKISVLVMNFFRSTGHIHLWFLWQAQFWSVLAKSEPFLEERSILAALLLSSYRIKQNTSQRTRFISISHK